MHRVAITHFPTPRFSRGILGALALLAVSAAGTVGARADCAQDFKSLMDKRMVEIGALNKISKSNGGKLDATLACPRLKNLAAAETQVVSYMVKNKDWCNLPDDLIAKMSASRVKTAGIAVKACTIAVQIKKGAAQQQAQQQQPQETVKLPTGPL